MATNPFDQFDSAQPAANAFDQFDGPTQKPKGFMSDVGTALKQGVQQLPGALTGLADIPLGLAGMNRLVSRAAERLGEASGFQPGKWAQETAQQYSPETQASRAEIDKAWEDPNAGALDVAGAYLRNPRATALNVVQSVPSIVAGGVAGRVAGLAGLASAPVRAAVGEGAVMAGQQMDQIDDQVDPQKAALAALGTGAAGAAAGALGGQAAARMGVRDIDTTLAGGAAAQAARAPGVVGRVARGAAHEAAEEAAQSAVEQGAQNWAEGKALTEGMARNVVEGSLAGGVMGAGAGAVPLSRRLGLDPNAGPLSAAAATAVDSGATLALPAPTVTVDGEGTARTAEQRQAERDVPGPVETGAIGEGRNSEQVPEPAPFPAPELQPALEYSAPPALGYDTAPTDTLITGADGTVRQETRAEAINRAQAQGEQQAVEDAEAQRRADLGMPPLTPVEQVRAGPARGETLELGADGVARPVDLLPQPTNRLRAGRAAREAGPGYEPVQVEGGWNVRPITSETGAAAAPEAARITLESGRNGDGAAGEPGRLVAGAGDGRRADAGPGLGDAGRPQLGGPARRGSDAAAGAVARGQDDLAVPAGGADAAVAPRALPAPATALDQAAHAAATSPTNDLPEPTQAQKEAGNYKVGRIKVHGLDISVENPKGSTRSGTGPDGAAWAHEMSDHYGYIRRTEGADGDQVDVYVGPRPDSQKVYVVDQLDQQTGGFDEVKAMLGYPNRLAAVRAYRSNFDAGWKVGPVTEMSVEQFKAWVADRKQSRLPAAQAMGASDAKDVPGARVERSPAVQAVGQRQGSVRKSEQPLLSQLRRQGRDDLPGVAGQLPRVPGGRGAAPESAAFARPDQQRPAVPAGQRAVGDQARAGAQPTQERAAGARRPDPDAGGVGRGDRSGAVDAPLPDQSGRNDRGASADRAAPQRPQAEPVRAVERPSAGREVSPDAGQQRPASGGRGANAAIEDVGEKIGGARKDTAVRGAATAKPRRAGDDDRPAWARRFKIDQVVLSTRASEAGRWVIRDGRSQDRLGQDRQLGRASFATREEAEAALPLLAVAMKHRPVPLSGGKWEIWRDVTDRKRVKVVDQAFDSRETALAYMAANAAAIIETNTTFGEADLPVPENKRREGPARRQGDVDGQAFRDTFGFRGVEFGNWNAQAERQELMNEAYDGLLDLAEVVGVPPRAISLNGDLALAFGARGQGLSSARAHYEQQRAVINLTKMKGAGALAHEWFHALDHYLGRQDGKAAAQWTTEADGTRTLKAKGGEFDMASGGFSRRDSGVRAELREAYEHVMRTMVYKAEKFVQDSAKAEAFVAQTREQVAQALDGIRKDLAAEKTYGKRFIKPATAEQLAAFDALAKPIVDGVALETEARASGTASRGRLTGWRWTNDALDQISEIYKAVRGRSGFDSTNRNGVLDGLRNHMARYSQRLKMLADAQQNTTAERRVPTEFAMDARSLDQGRGTDYWTTPHELAARAFQGYVQDRLAERGGRSPFLNYAPEDAAILTPWGWKRPYPAGRERVEINAAFDRMLGVLEARTGDDGNVVLSRAAEAQQARAESAGAAEIRRAVEQTVAGWKNAPPVVVVANPRSDGVHPRVRAHYTRPGAIVPNGSYYGGTVYLFTDHLQNPAEAQRVLFHEALGHAGLRGFFGPALNGVLDQVAAARADQVRAKAASYGFDVDNQRQRRMAAEEVLAEMAEQNPQLPLVRRAIAAIRTWLRENIPALRDLALSDAEIVRNFLLPARGFIERGPAAERAPSSAVPVSARAISAAVSAVPDTEKARFLQGTAILDLPGGQAPVGYPALRAWATKLFEDAGGRVTHPVLGDVLLDLRSVRDSMAHMMNPFKAEAFAAVPEVLRKGVVVLSATEGIEDSFYVSAPVRIKGADDIVTVLVRRNPTTQRMYLHSVATKEYLLTRLDSRATAGAAPHTGEARSGDAPIVTGAQEMAGLPNPRVSGADAEASKERSGSSNPGSPKKDPLKARDSGADTAAAASGRTGKVASGEVASVLRRLLSMKLDGQDAARAPSSRMPAALEKGNGSEMSGVASDVAAGPVHPTGSEPSGATVEEPARAIKSKAAGEPPMSSQAALGSSMGTMTPAQEAAWKRVAQLRQVPTLKERFDSLRANLGTKVRQGVLDQFAPIKEISPEAYMQARLSKGSDGTMEAALLYGRPFLRDGAADVDIKDGGFAQVLASLKGEHDRFLMWVAARRAERLQAEGKENLFTSQDIGALKTLNAGRFDDGTARTPVYAKALRDLNAFNDSVLAMAEESGLIDPEARALFKDQPYVPFYRVMEEGDMRGPKFSSGLVNQQAFKKLKGGSQQLNADLLENMLLNWSHLYSAAARNRAAQATMDAAEKLAVAHQVPEGTKGAVRVLRAGVAEHWAIEDPYLLDAVAALHYSPSPLMKPLAAMKNVLTYTVTVNPTFKIRNLIRDSLSAISQADLSYNPLRNVAGGWKATAADSQIYASMLASGGTIRFGTQENSARLRAQVEKLGGQVLDKEGWRKLADQVRTVWSAYEEFGDRVENVNRAALYEQLVKKGHSHAEASFMARDLMDFSLSGAWPVVRLLGQSVPFFNARLQGLYKLGRAAAEDPRRFGTMAAAVSLASLGLMAAYQDDDDWKKREDWDRDAYWWFKVGGTAFRIPKPFELGAIGTIAERSAELLFNDEMTGKRFGKRISDMVFGTFAMDPTPQIIKPLLDVYANKDSFTGRAIEGMSDERLRPQDRAGERTTEVARFLGQLGLPDPVQLAKGEYSGLSPKQIDFLLRGYFGWVGTTAAQLGDRALRPLMDRGERPAMELRDAFVAGNFVESLPSGSSRYVTQLYDRARQVDQAYASYRDALKRGDTEKAAQIREEEGGNLLARRRVNHAKEQLANINAQARMVEASRTLTAEEKRVRLDAIEERRDRVARMASVQ